MWYVAEILNLITVEETPKKVLHISSVLISANNPDGAHKKAMNLGFEGSGTYLNCEEKVVQLEFIGLRDLFEIGEKLENGLEISYSEHVDEDEALLRAYVTDRLELSVFQETKRTPQSFDYPNYMPGMIMDGLKELGFTDEDIIERKKD